MRKLIFAGLFASIFFIPAVAQENSVGSSQSAASVGAASEVGVVLEGFLLPHWHLQQRLLQH